MNPMIFPHLTTYDFTLLQIILKFRKFRNKFKKIKIEKIIFNLNKILATTHYFIWAVTNIIIAYWAFPLFSHYNILGFSLYRQPIGKSHQLIVGRRSHFLKIQHASKMKLSVQV